MPVDQSGYKSEWFLLLVVWGVTFVATVFKAVGRGDPLTPVQMVIRLLAKAAFTGIVAAGVWAGITQKFVLNPTFGVTVAAGVAMIGVEILEQLLVLVAQKRAGVTLKEEGGKNNG